MLVTPFRTATRNQRLLSRAQVVGVLLRRLRRRRVRSGKAPRSLGLWISWRNRLQAARRSAARPSASEAAAMEVMAVSDGKSLDANGAETPPHKDGRLKLRPSKLQRGVSRVGALRAMDRAGETPGLKPITRANAFPLD